MSKAKTVKVVALAIAGALLTLYSYVTGTIDGKNQNEPFDVTPVGEDESEDPEEVAQDTQ
jgi:hypothetical protein